MNSRALPQYGSLSEPAVEWTLLDLLTIFRRRRSWILASVAATSIAAGLYCLCATRRYRATAVIEVRKESTGAFGLDNATADRQLSEVADSFDDNLTLQTEVGILQSDAVSLNVIRRMGLESTPDYFAAGQGSGTHPGIARFWRKPMEPLSTPLASAPNRRYAALKIFAAHCRIAPQAGTRLIAISYSDPDPARAAAVANALVQALSDYRFQSRSAAAAASASWLSSQLDGLKEQTDALDGRAAALDRASGDYGDDSSHNPILARLDSLNAALSTAEGNRIVREAIWRAVQTGDPEAISGLAGNPNAGPNTQNSLALLQSLRIREAALRSQIAESADRYGENWPALAEQRAQLKSVQNSIQEEIHRLGDRAHTDYQVALDAENAARDAFTQQRKLAAQLTGNAVSLRLARQEAGESRALYTSLLTRLRQAGILEGLHSGNFAVVSPALVPPSDQPASPNILLLGAMAVCLGGLAGCGTALAREVTDTAVHTRTELEVLLDAPVFEEIPVLRSVEPWFRHILPRRLALRGGSQASLQSPASETPFVEALHRLRASLLLAHSDRPPQVITVTRSEPRRSSARAVHASAPEPAPLAFNLATILAQYGSSVLFVDADVRSAPNLRTSDNPGLTEILSNQAILPEPHPVRDLPCLSVVHAGIRPPCPSELIASSRMSSLLSTWREEFTFIVIQSPAPVFADALVLAQLSDAVLISAEAGRTRRAELLSAFHALSRQVPDHAVLGAILESVQPRSCHARA